MASRSPKSRTHPAERFTAPSTIPHGTPLADILDRRAVALVAESFAAVKPDFNARQFTRRAMVGLEALGLMQRGAHIAAALGEQLPADADRALSILISSLGPELTMAEGNGLAPFFYLPHSFVISNHCVAGFEGAIRACYELTKRFTAEFCIRPLLVAHQVKALKQLHRWTQDADPHVRRLVSEGTRPRLPWGIRLRAFQLDPRPTLALLEKLKDDSEPYVRRSVANHLGDILKDNPAAGYTTCERWIEESEKLDSRQAEARRWIVRHALRLPARQGNPRAVRLRRLAGG